jgi:hypothetical protein
MAEAAEKVEELTVPDGGIGNFIMDDAEIEEAYGEDDDGTEEYGDEGIAQFPALTKKMAAMGREGDNVIGHLETGELVIPRAFLEQNPEWKESIFKFLMDNGVEDPERYVVGSESNSLNPDTGAPEFFFKFIKKVVKGVVDTVKKVVKSVVKVIKKVAPIVLPIALAMSPLGAVYGAALGSGIGTLIQGGSIKDALKSALVAGATGAVFQGFTGPDSFTQNVKNALSNPGARFADTIAGATSSFGNIGNVLSGDMTLKEAFVGEGALFNPAYQTPYQQEQAAKLAQQGTEQIKAADTDLSGVSEKSQNAIDTIKAQDTSVARLNNTGTSIEVTMPNGQTTTIAAGQPIPAGATVNDALVASAYDPPSFTKSISEGNFKEAFFPSDPTAAQLAQAQGSAYSDTFKTLTAQGVPTAQATTLAQEAAKNVTAASLGPSLLRTYGPMAAVGTAVAAGSGFFTPPEPAGLPDYMTDENGNIITGETLIAQNPGKYKMKNINGMVLNEETGQYEYPTTAVQTASYDPMTFGTTGGGSSGFYEVPTMYTMNPNTTYLQQSTPGGPFKRPDQYAAQGGEIYPRRNGGIMPNEGVPGQDSVRAMLMPGEFVMTTDAVRGMGNGNVNQGIKNMYSVMRNLEARGRATA